MSGLALVWHLNGRPASADDLAPMLAEMARRGPEGEDVALCGPVALGHRHLRTTPEALVEPMPLTDPYSGRVLTGDIRLDNRDELLARFGLLNIGRVVGDGELVLHAHARWGEDCASHLLGDFAFAIWDPRQRRVIAARDQMGMRQLVYAHREGRLFACATSARAVALAPELKPPLNELRVAEALIDFEYGSLTSTFYEGVLRLPPGHCLTVGDNGLRLRAYWTMAPPQQLRLSSDEEYAEAFRDVLSTAVRARLRSAGAVGSMLSGGMDSGSVVALACRMTPEPLPTFSGVGPDPSTCVETRAIDAALAMPNLQPTLIDYSRLEPWRDDLIEAWRTLEEPWDFHMTVPRAAYLAASRVDVKVVLDGVAGDVALGQGSQMARHVGSGQFARAWRDARGLSRFYGMRHGYTAQQLVSAFRGAFMPHALRQLRAAWRENRLPSLPKNCLIDPAYADAVGLRKVLRDWNTTPLANEMSFADERVRSWPRSGLTVGRERYDRVAAHFGIEPRDPFMDRRVWDFCLSIPMDQFQSDGWPKMLLRRSMTDLVPDRVRWRQGKQHLGWVFTERLLGLWPDRRSAALGARAALDSRVKGELVENATLGQAGSNCRPQDELLGLSLFLGHAGSIARRQTPVA